MILLLCPVLFCTVRLILAAPIFTNEGRVAVAAGAALNDAEILGMNWLVDGVQGKIAK